MPAEIIRAWAGWLTPTPVPRSWPRLPVPQRALDLMQLLVSELVTDARRRARPCGNGAVGEGQGYPAAMSAEDARRTAADPSVAYVQQDGVSHSSGTQPVHMLTDRGCELSSEWLDFTQRFGPRCGRVRMDRCVEGPRPRRTVGDIRRPMVPCRR
ncbi:hypothetical protein ACE1SV_58310 [Streptomyces sennicomposti]